VRDDDLQPIVRYLQTFQQAWASHGHEYDLPGVQFETGLSNAEVTAVEERFGFVFPPDLRALLQHALPVGHGFVDWRSSGEEELRGRLDLPVDGICFDVAHNDFWMADWGDKPQDADEAAAVPRRAMQPVPRFYA
jgi:hypothetical protein